MQYYPTYTCIYVHDTATCDVTKSITFDSLVQNGYWYMALITNHWSTWFTIYIIYILGH